MLKDWFRVFRNMTQGLGKLGYPVDAAAWLFPSRKQGKLKQPSSLVNAIEQRGGSRSQEKTDEMTAHYSTVRLDEKRVAMDAAATKLRDVKVGTLVGTGSEKTRPPRCPRIETAFFQELT